MSGDGEVAPRGRPRLARFAAGAIARSPRRPRCHPERGACRVRRHRRPRRRLGSSKTRPGKTGGIRQAKKCKTPMEAVLEMHTRTRPLHGLLIHLMATGRNMRVEGGVTEERFEMESCFRHFTANYYPPRPEFEEPIPMQPDTNQHVLFTIFMHNGSESGLEFSRVIYGERIPRDKWSRIRQAPPHAVLVLAGYPIEVYNNGYYRTVKLRAFVNTEAQPRITVGLSIGPGLNAVVRTATEVEERSQKPSCYLPMKYIEIMEIMENNRLHGRIFDKEQVNYKAQQE
ncbi:UNVERIFIED_CONTAM: hypothetical protein Sangu_2692000 [Sesamum angustifolium]|uniref:Isopenicillin N synthase-like Fe(2+) 2OG dioxygenase domain-containing protein n=1 Tax=Sesamum angustifolium TaxID=2727405 RepID=A0AAW2IZ55_9LAMI